MSTKHNMDWGSIPEVGTGNVDFMRLQSGTNRVRVVGRPSEIEVHWEKGVDGSNKKVICLGSGCPICKAGHAPTVRYQVQVIDRTDNEVKILEGGKSIFNSIKAYAVDPEYGDPTKYDVKIQKEGSGRETRYTVMASPKKDPLTDEEQSKVEEAKDLSEINKVKTVDEINEMGLEVLVGSASDLASSDFDDNSSSSGDTVNDDDWEML